MIDKKIDKLNIKKMFTPARVITLGFLSVIFLGAFFLCLPISHNNNQWYSFVDALFTATSSVCVTGLAVVDTATEFTLFGKIIILLLIQIGGLGFMTLTTSIFIVLGKKINLKNRIFMQESVSEDNLKGVVRLAQRIVIYTFVFEGIGALLLSIQFIRDFGVGEGIFTAIFMSVSAFCNAGFDLMGVKFGEGTSLIAYQTNPLVLLTIASLIIVGGIGFAVIADITGKKKNKKLRTHTKVVLITTLVLILSGTALYLGFEYNNPKTIGNMSFGNKLLNALFQSVTPRTAGFAALSQENMSMPSIGLTMALMFIGASPASTGGGIKTTTFVVMIFYLWANLRGDKELVINKKQVTESQIKKAITIIGMAVMVLFLSVSTITLAESVANNTIVSFEKILFECISAFATVGLSLGITSSLTTVSKLVLCLVMQIGRIGPVTIGLALVKKSNKIQDNIRYPHSDIMLG